MVGIAFGEYVSRDLLFSKWKEGIRGKDLESLKKNAVSVLNGLSQ